MDSAKMEGRGMPLDFLRPSIEGMYIGAVSHKGHFSRHSNKMPEETCNLNVQLAQSKALILCLALGTIEAMRSGAWSLESGTWTMARPVFWEPLKQSEMPAEVIEVFQQADELGAIEKLFGRAKADALLERMSAIIREHLNLLPDKSWYLNLRDFESK